MHVRSEDSGTRSTRALARPLRGLLVALLAAAVGLTTAGVAAAAEAGDGPTAAAWGAEWLDDQFELGVPLEPFGSPDWGTTLEAALALSAVSGYDARTAALWSAFEAAREDAVVSGGVDLPGRLAMGILFAVAIGEDPTDVGAAGDEDLVARLVATRTVGGADTGLYGSQSATYDGAYRQGYALVALVAAGETPDASAIQWLLDQQCDDGSWMPYRADTSVACAFDAGMFVGPDTNSTAAAISGLAAVGSGGGAAVADALTWLDGVQEDDGGFSFFPLGGSDPNSTAMVMQALDSVGLLDDAAFTDRDGLPVQALVSFQLGCAEGVDAGSFTFPGTGGAPSAMATAQAVSAAAGASLGITGPTSSGSAAGLCTSEGSTTTTTIAVGGGDGPTNGQGGVIVNEDDSVRPAALAFTGASSTVVGLLGVALLAAGALALRGSRRVERG